MRLSKAQKRFISRWIHVQDYWLCRTGKIMECNPETGLERRVLQAMIRKGCINEFGAITAEAKNSWRRSINREERKLARERQQLVTAAGSRDQGRPGMAQG